MPKYLSEINFIKYDKNLQITTTHKMLLPYKYAKIFCNLISASCKKSFEQFFESDLEFQEIIYEFYGEIDDDDFENEVDYLKAHGNSCDFREIFDFFLNEGSVKISPANISEINTEEKYILKDLSGDNPDFSGVIKK